MRIKCNMYRTFVWLACTVPVLSAHVATLDDWAKLLGVGADFRNRFLALEEDYPNEECFSHILEYISHIGNETWADWMFDSSEKIPYGTLYGHTTFIGNYDECLAARSEHFTGKHCMIDFSFGESQSLNSLFGAFKYAYGICLPSTCHESHIRKVINALNISPNISVTVDEGSCSTYGRREISSDEWVGITIIACICFITVCSTVYELMNEKDPGKRHELYSSFSLRRNWKQLMKIYDGPGNIGCLHGIRTLTMFWVVLAHEYAMGMMNPSINRFMAFQYILSKSKLLITNAFVSVDTFFVMSGMLVTLMFFRDISKKRSYDIPVAMIHRFLRITPAYAAMVLLQSTLLLRLGNGPMWYRSVKPGVDMCKENWWPGLLYIQNFVAPNSSCLGQSWYLSSDMQMFWLSPLLLYPFLLSPSVALLVFILYLASALTTDIIIGVVFELGPQITLSTSTDQFAVEYVQTHTRLVPYIIGMGLAYVIGGVKAKKIRVNLSKTWVIVGWLASSALCLGSIYGMSYFVDNGFQDNTKESVSYLVFHRLGWSLGLSWVIFACFAGYGGIINEFLSWNGFQVLGKLSYCMFLVHFTIQVCKAGMTRTNIYLNDFDLVTKYFSTLVLSVFFSVFLYLLFELPFCNVDKYALRNLSILPLPRRKHEKGSVETAGAPQGADNKGFEPEQKS